MATSGPLTGITSGVPSGFGRTSLAYFGVGIAIAATVVATVPLPHSLPARALVIIAIVALDLAVVGGMWWRETLRYRGQLEDRLQAAEREVAQAERLASVGRIAAGIAHEVGNPLTGIANYTHVLRARAEASPEAEAALGGIEREVDRIDRIVRGLLDYARPQKTQPAPFDAAGMLRRAVQLLAEQGVFRHVQVNAAIDESPIALVGNPHEFEQVFVNVLLNAIDAMDAKGTLALYAGSMPADTVARPPQRRSGDAAAASAEHTSDPRLAAWRAQHGGAIAKFVIADSGPGIQPDDASRVFDPFFTTKGVGEGSGLGLAIVQRVVDSHDGMVWVQRAREGGAAFHIVLPLGAFPASGTPVS